MVVNHGGGGGGGGVKMSENEIKIALYFALKISV